MINGRVSRFKNLCVITFISDIVSRIAMGKIFLSGIIVKGLGEGTYFMSMQHYQNEIKKKLGFKPYPGTLNLKVGKKQINLLKKIVPIKINGFKSVNKTFGGASCYKAKIKTINSAIIIPDLTKHKDIIEIIAPVHMKSELKLKDGDEIQVGLL